MKINYTNKTIKLTKKEYKEATVFGSDMYTALKEAITDFPTFKIITKEPTKKKSPIGRITYEFMKKYILAHDDENKSIIKNLKNLQENQKIVSLKYPLSTYIIQKFFIKIKKGTRGED